MHVYVFCVLESLFKTLKKSLCRLESLYVYILLIYWVAVFLSELATCLLMHLLLKLPTEHSGKFGSQTLFISMRLLQVPDVSCTGTKEYYTMPLHGELCLTSLFASLSCQTPVAMPLVLQNVHFHLEQSSWLFWTTESGIEWTHNYPFYPFHKKSFVSGVTHGRQNNP